MIKLKKILVIVESIDVNDSSASKGRIALIRNLSKIGYELKVLHYTRKKIEIEEIDCEEIKEQKFNVYYLFSRVFRLLRRYFKLNFNIFFEKLLGFSFTYFNDVISIKNSIKKNIERNKYDLVLTLSKASSFRVHYAVLNSPNLHSKWIAYIHDPYPHHFYPEPYSWFEVGYKQKELFFQNVSEKAKHSIFPSKLLMEWMGGYFPNFLKTGVVVPHQNYNVNTINIKLPDFFDKNKFNILHAGNLMKPRNPIGLINGFNKFLENNKSAKKNSRLIFIGNMNYHIEAMKKLNEINKEIVIIPESLIFEEVHEMQNNACVNVILEAKSKISPFLPGKFPHCVAANKPIIILGPNKSELNRLLTKDYPYSAEIDDEIRISQIIEELYVQWLKCPESLSLDKPELNNYISENFLETVFSKL